MSENPTTSDGTLLTEATTATPASATDGATQPNDAAPGDAAAAAAAGADAANKTDADGQPAAAEAEGNENSESDGDAAEGEADEGVPEGDYSLKPPEGFDDLDPEDVQAVTPIAKELGLSNTKLQKLVDVYGPLIQRRVEGALKQQQEAMFENHRKQVDEWVATVKADKDLGGADFAKKVGQAGLALDKFGTPALRDLLAETKLGSHPEIVRFCWNVSRNLVEDGGLVRGAPTDASRRKTDAEVFFPELSNNTQGA